MSARYLLCAALLGGCPSGTPDKETGALDGPPVALPGLPECPGADFTSDIHPMPYPGNPWWFIRTSVSDVLDAWYASKLAATEVGCPSWSEHEGVETLSGDCVAEGVAFAGTWTYDREEGAMVFDGVRADGVYDERPLTLQGTGQFRWLDRDGTYTIEADGAYTRASEDDMDGTFTFTDLSVEHSADAFLSRGTVDVDWLYGTGRYCPVVELHAAPGCPAEPDGYWALQGADTWVIVADGSERCDDCVEVFLNGEWHDTYCDVYGDFL